MKEHERTTNLMTERKKPSITRHVLQLNGLTFEFSVNEESGAMRYHFPEAQRFRSLRKEVRAATSRQVIDWRNQIVSAWSARTGKTMLISNNGENGTVRSVTLVEGEKITTAKTSNELPLADFDAVILL